MRVMIDTNVIISAILFPKGKASQALRKCFSDRFIPAVCDYVINELNMKFTEKFPDKKAELELFTSQLTSVVDVVSTPDEVLVVESLIRDVKDRPILRAALNWHADLFLTGDKDFLESSITDPRIISVSDFLSI